MLEQNTIELYAFCSFISKSEIFTDEQILNSSIQDGFFKKEDAFNNIWQIQVKPKRHVSFIH